MLLLLSSEDAARWWSSPTSPDEDGMLFLLGDVGSTIVNVIQRHRSEFHIVPVRMVFV